MNRVSPRGTSNEMWERVAASRKEGFQTEKEDAELA